MRITDLLANQGFIILNKQIAKEYGLHEAIMIGELAQEYNYYDDKGMLEDGWFYSTIENVESATTLSAHQQRTALKHLEDEGFVYIQRRGVPAQRYFKLDMQALSNKMLKNLTSESENNEQLDVKNFNGNNNKEIIIKNNNKNNNKETVASVIEEAPAELQENLNDFIEMRKKNKSTMTVKAVKLLISKLDKLSGGDVAVSNAILEQSIINGWKSVYELKGGQAGGQHRRNTSDSFEAFDGFE